ncbi:MAG: DNA-binding NarL/FixJ family response regulator, partial [Salibacteraceae bacterium]
MKKPIRIAIAEDHELVRQGMVALLKEEKDINLVFDVGNG